MENEVVRRRINVISAHFGPGAGSGSPTIAFTSDDVLSSATHLLPMNCSGGLYSVVRRCDNKLYFARQGSDSQASFMRQISSQKQQHSCDASEGPMFSRPGAPLKSSGSSSSETPMYSRPSTVESKYPTFPLIRPPPVQDCNKSTADVPNFAKPDCTITKQKQSCSSQSFNGNGWSPRMGVSEVGRGYVVTIEIPGVGIKDIRVEVDDHKLNSIIYWAGSLRVMGKRSWGEYSWKVKGASMCGYGRRECGEEPYQVVWPLPADVNKDTVSAQYIDGVLHIIIPKL